jgi:membrane protein implicated in regulation of membrane protease activity
LNPIIKPLVILAFLVGIPAWFIGWISAAAFAVQLLYLPLAAQYPIGGIAVAIALWVATISSRELFKRLGIG